MIWRTLPNIQPRYKNIVIYINFDESVRDVLEWKQEDIDVA